MTDQGTQDDRPTRPDAGSNAGPAAGPVIDMRDLPSGAKAEPARAASHPTIESSLVGTDTGLPAATPRAAATDADRLDADRLAGAADTGEPRVDSASFPADPGGNTDRLELTADADAELRPPTDPDLSDAPLHNATARLSDDVAIVTASVGRAASAPVRRGGFWPLVLGGMVAAGLGAAAMWFAVPQRFLPSAVTPPAAEAAAVEAAAVEAARTAAIDAARVEIETRTAALTEAARAAGTEAAQAVLAAEPDAPATATAVPAELTATLDEQAARIAALESRPVPATAAPAPNAAPDAPATAAPDTAAVAALQAEVRAQAAKIEELAARPTIDPAAADEVRRLSADAATTREAVDAATAAIEARVAGAQQQADALAAKVDDTNRRVQDTAALTALESALVNGSDGAAATAQLQAAGVQPPAALAQPIPPLTDLQRDFPDAARAGLRAALRDGAGSGGTGGGLTNFLRVQTGARSVTPRDGTDADAVLSRAGDAVARGDIAAALTEVGTLPAAAQTAMQDWTAPATAWAAASQAASALKTSP